MNNIAKRIELYCKANGVNEVDFIKDVIIADDGRGNVSISEWNIEGLAQPTTEQLESYGTEATTEINKNVVRLARQQLYGTWEQQLEEIFDDGIDSWKARIQTIKNSNPF